MRHNLEIASITIGGLTGFMAQNPAIAALVSVLFAALAQYLQQFLRTKTAELKAREAESERLWNEQLREGTNSGGGDGVSTSVMAGSDRSEPTKRT